MKTIRKKLNTFKISLLPEAKPDFAENLREKINTESVFFLNTRIIL